MRKTLEAVHEAWVALIRAGVKRVTFELDERSYFVALWEACPEVRIPLPNTKAIVVWTREAMDLTSTKEPRPEDVGPLHQAFVTPEQEREFHYAGLIIRRGAP